MRAIIPNNLPDVLSGDMTVEGFKKLVEGIIKKLNLKDALELTRYLIRETGTSDIELEICEYAVDLVREKMIHQIKSA